MRICRWFPVSALTLLFACASASAVSSPSLPAAVWQVDMGIAQWIAPRSVQTRLPVPPDPAPAATPAILKFSPVQLLTDLANGLRNIRYKRGGRNPATGFDCSGFVRYVFHQGIGADLPNTSAAQFRTGQVIARDAMRSGDLVFFRTRGKRVSHVGIYLGDGRFIHAPSSGKTVGVSSLSEHYWSRRFVGARRPDVLVAQQDGSSHGNS